jgi:gas vesicle protein
LANPLESQFRAQWPGAPQEGSRSLAYERLRSIIVASWAKDPGSVWERLPEPSECSRWKAGVQNGAFFGRERCNARHFLPPADLLVCGHPLGFELAGPKSVPSGSAKARPLPGDESEGVMISQQRRIDDPVDPWSGGRSRAGNSGSLLLATLLGVGIGLLAAPQPGSKTRKLLRQRLATLGEGVGESLGEVQEVSSKARERAKKRLAKLREDAGDEFEDMGERWQKAKSRIRDFDFSDSEDDSSPFGSVLAIAAGLAATYFLTSERAAPVRSRVQDAAADVRRRATDQWDRFQRGGYKFGAQGTESRTAPSSPDEGSTPE